MASYAHPLFEPDSTEPDVITISVESTYGASVHKFLGVFN